LLIEHADNPISKKAGENIAVEKQYLDDDHSEEEKNAARKRSRITIDVTPSLRRRIRLAALKNDLSITEYVGQILEDRVPLEETTTQLREHPVTLEFLEEVYKVRQQVIQDAKGEPFEDSVEAIRRAREERTRELMGEPEERKHRPITLAAIERLR